MEAGTILYDCDGHPVLFSQYSRDHMQAHPEVLALLKEAVSLVRLSSPEKSDTWRNVDTGESGEVFGFSIEMGRTVGKSICVPAPSEGPFFFAMRRGRDIPTRVIADAEPLTTTALILWIRRYDDGHYEIRTCYAGTWAPREPSDREFFLPRTPELEREFQKCLNFWREHALIFNPNEDSGLHPGTWEEELKKLGIL